MPARLLTGLYVMNLKAAAWIDFDNLIESFLMHPYIIPLHKYNRSLVCKCIFILVSPGELGIKLIVPGELNISAFIFLSKNLFYG